jgi:hypothetical protein
MPETVIPEFTKPLARAFDRTWSRPLACAIKWVFAGKPAVNSYVARMERARRAGYTHGSHEAHLFQITIGKDADRDKAIDWLNASVEIGREELLAQRAFDREIEAWDISCRIMFMVTIVGR